MNGIDKFLLDLQIIPAVAAPLAAASLLLVERKAWKIYILAIQYVIVAWLVLSSLPGESAVVKLVAGLISTAILYLGAGRSGFSSLESSNVENLPRGRFFRLTAVLLVVIGTLGVSLDAWMPIEAAQIPVQQAAALLVALGLLGLGLSVAPLQVGVSLMTIVSGFEIIYSALEPSLAIVALLALVHLGLALVVSYFEIIRHDSASEESRTT